MLEKDIDKNIAFVKNKFGNAPDISFREYIVDKKKLVLVFNESITEGANINNFILKKITSFNNAATNDLYNFVFNNLPNNKVKEGKDYTELLNYIYNGFVIILIDGYDKFIAVEEKKNLYRSITEPMTEQTISGPKDSFNESYMTNIGLIRKRIKSDNLKIEESVYGKETKNKLSVLYMDNIVQEDLVIEVRNRLKKINIDAILDSSYVEEIINDNNSSFPTLITTERPDLAVMSLLEGRVLIVVENSPYVIVIPTFFVDLFHAPEDNYQKSINVTFTRVIRMISFILAIILPSFYIAITTYNHETIPTSLLVNFASQRATVPFPAVVEALGMILVFEVLRESDVRLPKFSGSAISILGAIVLGDAAVSAGIVSPIMLIIIATSAICSLTFSQIAMVNAIRLWRIIFMIFATCFGMPGIFMAVFFFLAHLTDLTSFNKPYIYPVAPFNFTFFRRWIFKLNIKKDNKRSKVLTNKNYIRSRL